MGIILYVEQLNQFGDNLNLAILAVLEK